MRIDNSEPDRAEPDRAAPDRAAPDRGITRDLVEWSLALRREAIPAEVRAAARRHLLDTLGCIIAGARQPLARDVAAVFAGLGRMGGAILVPGTDMRADVLDAAYLAGVSAHGLELDDGYREGSTHPGAVIVPVALAVAQATDAGLGKLLQAIVAGYEIMTVVARTAHPAMRQRGFHPTATSGVFGAAMAAATLYDLDRQQSTHALGIAASAAAGLFAFVSGGADVKRLHPGHAAREGVFAALLAARGIKGPPDVLEGPDGFFQAFAGRSALIPSPDLPPPAPWGIANCYLKPYPCCRHLHPAIDAVAQIMSANRLAPGEIERIDIETYAIAARHARIGWEDFAASQLSFAFAIATMARHGGVELAHFGDAARADPLTNALCGRVHVRATPAMDERYRTGRPADVTIHARGAAFHASRDEALGAPQQPLAPEAVDRKFASLVDGVIGIHRRERLIALIGAGEPHRRVADLVAETVPLPLSQDIA